MTSAWYRPPKWWEWHLLRSGSRLNGGRTGASESERNCWSRRWPVSPACRSRRRGGDHLAALACLFRTDLRADRSDRYGAGYGPMGARASGRYCSRFTCGSDSEMYQVKGKSRATLTDGASTPLEDARFSRRVHTTFCAHCTNPGMEKY
jgi:hypothetical protein